MNIKNKKKLIIVNFLKLKSQKKKYNKNNEC